MTFPSRVKKLTIKIADGVMPWAAAHATVWPSTHSVHGHLVEQIRDLEERRAAAVDMVEQLDEWLRAVDGEYIGSRLRDEVRSLLADDD